MKLQSLISAVVLGMAVLVQAQTSPDPQAPKPALKFTGEVSSGAAIAEKPALKLTGEGRSGAVEAEKPVGAYLDLGNRMETLILKAGPLTEVVAQVERQVKENPKQPNGFLPNLVYAKDIREAVVPGDLTLRGVNTVQALALVAAAAGCTFQPIFSPDEKAGQERLVIGYRIELQAASGSGKASDGRPMNTSSMNTPSSQFWSSVSPFGSSGGSGVPSASTGGASIARVRVVDDKVLSGGMSSGSDRSRVPKNSFAEPAGMPVDNNQPFVRVYAIGFIMTGTDEEKGSKMSNLQDLIGQALNQAKLDLNPGIDFHVKTGALLSKATAAQHEIIGQVVQAMKENQTDTDLMLIHRRNLDIEQAAQALKKNESQPAAPAKP